MRTLFLSLTIAATPWLGLQQSNAADYPSKPVRIIVANAPGGTADVLARLVAEKLSDRLKGSVVVENRPGAAGIVATEQAARAEPDGYTLYVANAGPLSILPNAKKVGYRPIESFEYIALAAISSEVLAINPNIPAKTVSEFVAYAKANPGKLSFGSSGHGSVTHLSCELVRIRAGIDLVHVPFRGSAETTNALLGNHIQVACSDPSIMQYVADKQVTALAVTTEARSPLIPSLPTLKEAGVPGIDAFAWLGFSAPAGTPKPIVALLAKEITSIVSDPAVVEVLNKSGLEPRPLGPDEFKQFILNDTKKWGDVIRSSNMTFE